MTDRSIVTFAPMVESGDTSEGADPYACWISLGTRLNEPH